MLANGNAGFVTSGISNVNVTSWEVRFGFSSTLVSLITVVFDIAAGILVLPITYFGAHAHQMRMLAFSALIMAAGFFVMTIPHWITGVYEIGADVRETCEAPSFSGRLMEAFYLRIYSEVNALSFE